MADGTWDDEDPEARARHTRQQFLKIMAVTCFTAAAYMFLHLMFFGVEASEYLQLVHLENGSDSDTDR